VKAFTSRTTLAVALLAGWQTFAAAQKPPMPKPKPKAPPPADGRDYRRFFKKPTNTAEFWDAIKFEMEVGRFDLAAQLLHEMLAKKPTPEELVALNEKEGTVTFLRLRLVPRWYEDRNKDRLARKDVDLLIDSIIAAVKAKLSNPDRIKLFIKNLFESPEENGFARIELAKSGAAAVPFLVEEMRRRPEAERGVLIDALSQFGIDTVAPLLAALDIDNASLRANLIDILRKRRDFTLLKNKGIDPAPFLWPLASSIERSDVVRRKAQQALAVLLDLDSPTRLPLAKEVLTAEAEKYYYHKVRFIDPRQVPVWRWDGKKLFEDKSFSASKAEEYYGLRFARQALAIDPRYEPAQLVLLSLLLDKGYVQPTPQKPLGTLKPSVQELLTTLNPDLVVAVLDRALRDERALVVLGAVEALGRLADVRSIRPSTSGEPALVRALHYGDRRVQMAAVDSLLHIPGVASAQANARIVDILRSVLMPEAAASTRPRVMVALADEHARNEMAEAVKAAGGDVALAATGRAAMRRLKARSDVDVVLIDSALPNPGTALLLAQLRADRDVRRLPVFLAAVPDGREARYLLDEVQNLRVKIDVLDREIRPKLEARAARQARYGPSEVDVKDDPLLADQRKRKARLEDRLRLLTERYDALSVKREDELRRFVEKYRNVWVVGAGQLNDPRQLQARLEEQLRAAGMPPLTQAERKQYAETALRWLARMASGELKGFEVRPAADAVMNVFQAPPLSDQALLDAIRITGTLPGARPQKELIGVLLDAKRAPLLRVAAADELQRNIQQFGRPDPAQEKVLKANLARLLAEPKLDALLRTRLARLVGTLRPDDRTDGQRLRNFRP
jgi:CheY-like chemotaxis protein